MFFHLPNRALLKKYPFIQPLAEMLRIENQFMIPQFLPDNGQQIDTSILPAFVLLPFTLLRKFCRKTFA
jgi:hypothetical protein